MWSVSPPSLNILSPGWARSIVVLVIVKLHSGGGDGDNDDDQVINDSTVCVLVLPELPG